MARMLKKRVNASVTEPRLDLYRRLVIIEDGVKIRLPPMEYSLYLLFQAHPEGIKADKMLLHRDELALIYAGESRYDDKERQYIVVDAICNRNKAAFYICISRIKKRFVSAVGIRKASKYIICRNNAGVYRARVCIAQFNTKQLKIKTT